MKKVMAMVLLGVGMSVQAQVRLNQVGVTPEQEKTVVVEGAVKAAQVKIVKQGQIVYALV